MNFLDSRDMSKVKGYTLLEILIVIFIIAIIGITVVLRNVNHPSPKEVEAFTKLLELRIKVARQQAIYQTRVLGLKIKANEYEFLQYDIAKHHWSLLSSQDSFWQRYSIPNGISLSNDSGLIMILPSGEITPFILRIQGKNGIHPMQMSASGYGGINVKLLPE